MSSNLSLSHWLKQNRRALDLTQAELADRIGCSLSTLQKFEAGTRRPSKQMAELLAIHLQIPADKKESFLQIARTGEEEPATVVALSPVAPPAPSTLTHNLPLPLTALIGRSEDMRAIHDLLTSEDVRLVTIVGTPGVGKTRLSLAVARQLAEHAEPRFADGIGFVPLAAIRDPALVLSSLAHALDLRPQGSMPILAQLVQRLRPQRTLLVLDNFEQIMEAATDLSELLAHCPTLKVLVTSRAPLLLRGEHLHPLPPFAVPAFDNAEQPNNAFTEAQSLSAVQLFVSTVQRFDARFQLVPANVVTILKICSRLDGVALAIELAAARLRQFTLEALLTHLQQPHAGALTLLTGGARDLPDRHRTLQNAIAWSYDLLDEAAQRLFAICGVFVGGFTYEAISQVAVGAPLGRHHPLLLSGLQMLLDHSLLVKEEQGGQSRYAMLETIREFALSLLERSPDARLMRNRHAEIFNRAAAAASKQSDQHALASLFAHLHAEYPNFCAALQWLIEQKSHDSLHLATSLKFFWYTQGLLNEGRYWLLRALQSVGEATSESARAWLDLANLAQAQDDIVEAESYASQAYQLFQTIQDSDGIAHATSILGWIKHGAQRYQEAEEIFRVGLQHVESMGNQQLIARFHFFIAHMQRDRGIYHDDLRHHIAALFEKQILLDDLWGAAHTGTLLVRYDLDRADYAQVSQAAKRTVELARKTQDKQVIAWAEACLGESARIAGETERAAHHLQLALQCFTEIGSRSSIAEVTYYVGRLTEQQSQINEAQTYYQQALDIAGALKHQLLQIRCTMGLLRLAQTQKLDDQAKVWSAKLEEFIGTSTYILPPADRVTYEKLMAVDAG